MHKDVKIDKDIEEDDMIALCIIIVRYVIQMARFITALKESSEMRQSIKNSEIKLDNFKPTDLSTEIQIEQEHDHNLQDMHKQFAQTDTLREQKSPQFADHFKEKANVELMNLNSNSQRSHH